MINNILPFPPKGCTSRQQLEFYNKLIDDGLDQEQLRLCLGRVKRIDPYFDDQATYLQLIMLQSIKELLE